MTASTVYLIEDDEVGRMATALLLDVWGFAVEEFESAEDFLDAVTEPSGCLLADYRLPGMSGLQLFLTLRRQGWQIPCVMISAHAGEDKVAEGLAAGVSAFFVKPVDAKLLVSAVRQCCSGCSPGN